MLLGDIVVNGDIDKSFFIEDEDLEKWKCMKGAKTIERTSKTGFSYTFSEGPIAFPDPSTVPVVRCSPVRAPRTAAPMRLPTRKQGSYASCCRRVRTHERFPDGLDRHWDAERQRYFIMGNALCRSAHHPNGQAITGYLITKNQGCLVSLRFYAFRHEQEVPYHGEYPCC